MVVDIASFIRVEGVHYGTSALTAPWSARIECATSGALYRLERGEAWFELLDGSTAPVLVPIDAVVAVARGRTHVWRDSLQTSVPEAPRALPFEPLAEGSRQQASVQPDVEMLVARLPPDSVQMEHAYPPVVILSPGQDAHARVKEFLDLIARESTAGGVPGERAAIVQRLTEIIIIELLRFARCSTEDTSAAWSTAGQDRYVVRALALIHERPEHDWRVEALSRAVGLSRSAFAERFRAIVGESPMNYVTRVRMRRAIAAIQLGQQSLGSIALEVGYHSETAFNRAFHRLMGVTPGRFRASVREKSRGRGAAQPN